VQSSKKEIQHMAQLTNHEKERLKMLLENHIDEIGQRLNGSEKSIYEISQRLDKIQKDANKVQTDVKEIRKDLNQVKNEVRSILGLD